MTNTKPEPGVFVVKGDVASVQPFSISINDSNEIEISPVVLHTGIDMTTYWLEIAYKHLIATEKAHNKLMLAKEEQDNEKMSRYLKKESTSGMQAIMASGIALDAYYASVKEHVNIPQATIDSWRKKSTARYKQITEVLRIGFCLNRESVRSLRDVLKQNFNFRDRAVHPNAGTAAPLLHVELNKVTDWRYATFRFFNAKAIFGLSLSVVYKTANKDSEKISDNLKSYCGGIKPRVKPIRNKWKNRYGELL